MQHIDLNDRINSGDISPTGARHKLPVALGGIPPNELFPVYFIPIKFLYYND